MSPSSVNGCSDRPVAVLKEVSSSSMSWRRHTHAGGLGAELTVLSTCVPYIHAAHRPYDFAFMRIRDLSSVHGNPSFPLTKYLGISTYKYLVPSRFLHSKLLRIPGYEPTFYVTLVRLATRVVIWTTSVICTAWYSAI